MRVLVTGGGGFIGSHLAERLLDEGHEVRVLDNFATGRRSNLLPLMDHLEVVEGDLRSYERVHNAVRDCEVVFHQAALPSVPRSIQDPLTSNAVNAEGTLSVLLAARDAGAARVIYASSSSVYGPGPTLPKSEDLPPTPLSPYAVAKLAGENYCRSFHAVYGLDTVALRYFNVFGERQDPRSQYAAVIPNFIAAILEGRAPRIFGDGQQSRDFTYVDNVVDANLSAMRAEGVAGSVYNIGCGERTTISELAGHIADLMGTQIAPEYLPARPGEIKHSVADVSRARGELGYSPRVSLQEGLTRVLEQHKHEAELAGTPVRG